MAAPKPGRSRQQWKARRSRWGVGAWCAPGWDRSSPHHASRTREECQEFPGRALEMVWLAGPCPRLCEDEPVVGQEHRFGQAGLRFLVRQVVGHVDEVGAARADAVGNVDGLLQREVRGVGAVAERV